MKNNKENSLKKLQGFFIENTDSIGIIIDEKLFKFELRKTDTTKTNAFYSIPDILTLQTIFILELL